MHQMRHADQEQRKNQPGYGLKKLRSEMKPVRGVKLGQSVNSKKLVLA